MTDTISPPLHALMLLFVWSVLAARWALLRFRLYDIRLTHSLTFACSALTLKDPTVASVVIPEIGATLTRTLVHILILFSIAALIGVYNAWDRFEPRWRQPLLYTVAGCLGIALVALSTSAREQDVTVEEAGGWQAVAYFALYASLTVYGLRSRHSRVRLRTQLARNEVLAGPSDCGRRHRLLRLDARRVRLDAPVGSTISSRHW